MNAASEDKAIYSVICT